MTMHSTNLHFTYLLTDWWDQPRREDNGRELSKKRQTFRAKMAKGEPRQVSVSAV